MITVGIFLVPVAETEIDALEILGCRAFEFNIICRAEKFFERLYGIQWAMSETLTASSYHNAPAAKRPNM